MVASLLKRGLDALSAGRPALAVEAFAAASVHDIQQEQQTFLRSALGAGVMADLYTQALRAAEVAPVRLAPRTHPTRQPTSQPGTALRVTYVLWQLNSTQAATRRVGALLRAHDRARLAPAVLVTEDLTARAPATTILSLPDAPSVRSGEVFLNAARAAGAPVQVLEARGDFIQAGLAAARALRDLHTDVAVFLGGPSTPVQIVAAAARGAPVQINLNIGVPMLTPGIDHVLYTNPSARAADLPELTRRGFASSALECSGCDAKAAASAAPADRASLGLPARGAACVFVTASNKLPQRLAHAGFARDLAASLKAHPAAWWVGIGRGDFTAALQPLRDAGVIDRVVLTGPLDAIAPVLKACDVYLNEYPEGGYNTVVESMSAGTPVVALSAGSGHAENAGAGLVGTPDAIASFDREAYWHLAATWMRDASARSAAAARQRDRALAKFDYASVCGVYEVLYDRLARGEVASPGGVALQGRPVGSP